MLQNSRTCFCPHTSDSISVFHRCTTTNLLLLCHVAPSSEPLPPSKKHPKVTFNLPEALQNKRLLFSGLIRLLPTPGQPGVPAVTLPYQGFAAPLQHLRLAARPAENSADGDKLKEHSGGLCYSPRATPSFYLEVMDHLAKVCVCVCGRGRW